EDGRFRLEATDGKRLVIVHGESLAPRVGASETFAALEAVANSGTQTIVPAADWKRALRMGAKRLDKVGLVINSEFVTLACGSETLTARPRGRSAPAPQPEPQHGPHRRATPTRGGPVPRAVPLGRLPHRLRRHGADSPQRQPGHRPHDSMLDSPRGCRPRYRGADRPGRLGLRRLCPPRERLLCPPPPGAVAGLAGLPRRAVPELPQAARVALAGSA